MGKQRRQLRSSLRKRQSQEDMKSGDAEDKDREEIKKEMRLKQCNHFTVYMYIKPYVVHFKYKVFICQLYLSKAGK